MSAADTFNLLDHLRDKTQRLERELAYSRKVTAQQTRLLAFIIRDRFDNPADATAYLKSVEAVDEHMQTLQ